VIHSHGTIGGLLLKSAAGDGRELTAEESSKQGGQG